MEVQPWPSAISLRSPQAIGSDPFLSHYQISPELMGDVHHTVTLNTDITQDLCQKPTPDVDIRPTKPGKMHSGTRLTCEPCRERKVKCNRMFPECNRCARLGYKCTYRDRVSHRASQAAVIQQLQERMSQAEARLAQQGITMTPGTSSPASQHQTIVAAGLPPPPPSSSASSIAGSIPRTVVHHHQPESPVDMNYSATTSMGIGLGRAVTGYDQAAVSMVQDTPTLADFDFSALDSTGFGHHDSAAAEQAYALTGSLDLDLGSPALSWNQMRRSTGGEPSSSYHYSSVSLSSTDETTLSLSVEDMATLHQIFFNNFTPVMPILYKDRFYRELQDSPNNLALKSVSYTICLLAILISEQHGHLEKTCYTLARRYIDECEIEDESNTLSSIRFFQSLLFLTRYELGRRNCTRASMLLGRAVRLGKMLRLDELDKRGDKITPVSTGILGMPYGHLRPPQDEVELEERRRCLWALYIIEGYSTIHTGQLGTLNDEELLVSLPSPGNLDSKFSPTPMPTLSQATSTIQNPEKVTPTFTGLILVVSLLRKVVQHTLVAQSSKSSSHPTENLTQQRLLISTNYYPSPGFWDRHYSLIVECNDYGNALQHFSSLRSVYNDPLAFNIHLTFCAIELRLWDAALDEAERNGLPNIEENMRNVQACAFKIGNTVRSTWGMQRLACDNLSLSGAFVAWPLCMAIKGLNRQLAARQNHGLAQQDADHTVGGRGKGAETSGPQQPTGSAQALSRENMDKIALLQILCSALDEVESPTGPWHESIAGFVNANVNLAGQRGHQ